jgi:hypothetical protein
LTPVRCSKTQSSSPLTLLQDGSINPTTVRVLSTSLSAENHVDVLREAIGRTKLEVKAIVARLRPAPDVPTTLRQVPEPMSARRHPEPPTVPRTGEAPLFQPPAVQPAPRSCPTVPKWSHWRPPATATS